MVVYSALWPILRILSPRKPDTVERILETIIDAVGSGRTLLMPTFTDGFRDGVIDLDNEAGWTGALPEALRKRGGARRTASAFFSFAVLGPDADDLAALRPRESWGEHFLYAWMEERNAHMVTLGVPAATCSFIHHVEWIQRSLLPYRSPKTFKGRMIRDGREETLEETLLVRQLDPEIINDFTPVEPLFEAAGLERMVLDGVEMTELGAAAMIRSLSPLVEEDPWLLAKPADGQ